ncbi:MAG: hypothetical protein HY725_15995 [Candidatus Rokubacteria bacterium]|nr:hypothetical protein [Candidatus Rokubacteria bacterium]
MTQDRLRSTLREGRVAYGLGHFSGAPSLVEAAAYAGFDFVYLDMHQAPLGLETVSHLVRAADASGISPIIRVSENNPTELNRALNLGPAGVMVPHVETVEDAKRVVHAAKYHPVGDRQACPSVRAARYSDTPWPTFTRQANAETLVCVLLESAPAIERARDIAAVDGVDVLLVGVHDLSTSLGLAGENFRHSRLFEHLQRVVAASAEHGKVVWTTTVTTMEENYVDLLERAGVRMISFYTDEGIFLRACQRLLKTKTL